MPLSPSHKIAVMAQETAEREICLLTITHPDFDAPVLLSTDPTEYLYSDEDTATPIYGTKSRGKTFTYVPIEPTLPSADSEAPPSGRFSISNVSQVVAPYLLAVNDEYPKITVEVVMASDPDSVTQVWPEFDLTTAAIDASKAEVQISLNSANTEPVPWLRFTPACFPNLFS